MITISSRSRYAVQALTELARLGALPGGKPVPIAEVARRRDIPLQFLEQLFATLRRAGVLQSQRGVKGGYTFMRDPADITVLDIVQLLDGVVEAEHDPGKNEASTVWSSAVAALRDLLNRTTVADGVQQGGQPVGR